MGADVAVRIAAALFAFTGLGFGLPGVYGMHSLATGRGVLVFMGFPTYGNGPFEHQLGLKSTAALVGLFVVVCALEVVAAVLLWQGRLAGAWLGVVLLLPGAIFWWGFALPIPPVLAVVRTGLLAWRWGTLT
jgi:hypothetical protein